MHIEIENQEAIKIETEKTTETNIETENQTSVDLEMGISKGFDMNISNTSSVEYEIGKNKNTSSYNNLKDKPSINGVELIGNKTTEELGIVGTSMTEIELSTDITNPTEIINYIGKSGTYVAKNAGVLGTGGEPMVVLAKGQFITISNLQELASIFGVEIPDNQNIVQIDARLPDGTYRSFQIIGGKQLKEIAWITSENVNDYVDSFNPNDFINSSYGIYTLGGRLAINSATQTDIYNGYDTYKPITSNNIDYAVKLKGKNYFVDKTEFNTLETDLTTLKTEIETILESVVSINE